MLVGCAPPRARIVDIRFDEITLKSFSLVFDVEVTNRSSLPIPLASLDYELASDGVSFFAGQQELDGAVPANASRTLSLPATVNYSQLLLVLADAKLGKVVPYEAELGVALSLPVIDKYRLPLRKTGKLPLPAPPNVELLGIQWDKLTLDHAGGTLRLRLTNPNDFEMTLDGMAMTLALGGMAVGDIAAARAVGLSGGGGAGDLTLPLSFSPRKLGLVAIRMLTGSSTYALKGEISANTEYGRMRIPIARAGRVSLSR